MTWREAYDVVIEGRLLPGRSASEVESALEQRFGMSGADARALREGGRQVVKRRLEEGAAQTYVAALRRCGLIARAVPFDPNPPAALVERPGDDGYRPPAERIRRHNEALDAQIRGAAYPSNRLALPHARTRLVTVPDWFWPAAKAVIGALCIAAIAILAVYRRFADHIAFFE